MRSKMKGFFLVTLFLINSTFLFAQQRPDPNIPQGTNLEVPEGWHVRLDRPNEDIVIDSKPDSSDIYFVNMTPGWHVTTGPAGIFYHPANTISGDYQVHTSIHFFNPEGRNREGYGIFFGGKNLDADNQQYVYFLLRNTGEYLIKTRSGDETAVLQEWTAHDEIKTIKNGNESSSVKNVLAVDVSGNTLSFTINGVDVATLNKDNLNTSGIFGLRVNHSVNIHVSDLGVK
ncbi:MAG: hypothetical protein FH748_13900 [Balneolaceae bacterium]|nr:hypothetical protein [Balneolaceae bacterium]